VAQSNPLLDLLPVGRELTIGRGKVQVVGIPLSFFGKILGRFPDLRKQIVDGTAGMAAAFLAVPDAIPMFLAAGIGKPGDAEAEDVMGRITAIDQLTLLNEIIVETKGGESGPLAEKLKAVAISIGFDPAVLDSVMQGLMLSPPPSSS
jgi:hypothetical protein